MTLTDVFRTAMWLVLAVVVGLTISEAAQGAPPKRGTVEYCRAHAEGVNERACIIRIVWKGEGRVTARKAVLVAWCESTMNTRARNRQYWGLFQVSRAWRSSIPGFAWNAEAQARHALKVFKAVRRDWTPTWSCG